VQQTLGRYRIVSELGRGAMGAVYRAVDPLIEREVAIKTLLPNLPADILAEVRERFLREARSAGRLNHPNIVTIFDVGEHEGVAYIAMELLEGRSLQQVMASGERLPFASVADLAAQVADALDHAQRYSIVHRDVKPANIMVDAWGRAKLTDFGVAHIPASSMTQTGATLGSPKYMSPEQVLGQPPDPRSDLFSLGVVLYEMLTGRNPFVRPNDTAFSLMHRIAGEPHMPLREAGAQLEMPGGFERIVERALSKKPEQRYQRAAEMASDLRNYKGFGGSDDAARTQAVRAGARPAAPAAPLAPGAPVNSQLLSDLDKFVVDFDHEEQAKTQAAEETRLRAEDQARRRRKAQAFEPVAPMREADPEPAAATGDPQDKRRAALDLIQKRASSRPAAEAPAAPGKTLDALDRALREADRYLAEIVAQINSAHPDTEQGYDFLYIGRVPSVSLSDGYVFSRSTRAGGHDVCEMIKLTYRAAPRRPHVASLQGAEIERCVGYLISQKAEHKAVAEQRNDFGQPTRSQITVTGSLPCEVNLRGDYEKLAVSVELEGVRRIGKYRGEIAAGELEAAVDELVHYILGADSKFEKRVRRA
jgi:Protein kinase domain